MMTLNTPIYHTSQDMADVSKPNPINPLTVVDNEKQTSIPAVGYVTKKAYITSMLIVGALLLVVLVISILGNVMATPAAGSVDSTKLKSQSITQEKLADRVIVGSKVAEKQIQNEHLADGAITSDKIKNGTIVLSDLAANSVNSEKIVKGAIQLEHMDDESVDSSKIANGAIALVDLAANSVDSSKIVNLSILNGDLAPSSVDTGIIVDGTIQLGDMGNDSVDSSKIIDGSIASFDLAESAVTASKLGVGVALSNLLNGPGTVPLWKLNLNIAWGLIIGGVNSGTGVNAVPLLDGKGLTMSRSTVGVYFVYFDRSVYNTFCFVRPKIWQHICRVDTYSGSSHYATVMMYESNGTPSDNPDCYIMCLSTVTN